MIDEISEVVCDINGVAAILDHTARVVTAYLGHNELSWNQIPDVVLVVGNAFRTLRRQSTLKAEEMSESESSAGDFHKRKPIPDKPVVPVGRLVTHDHVVCAACGFEGVILKRHLRTEHALSPDEYLAHYDLPRDLPLTAPAYSESRSRWAKHTKLGQNRWTKRTA